MLVRGGGYCQATHHCPGYHGNVNQDVNSAVVEIVRRTQRWGPVAALGGGKSSVVLLGSLVGPGVDIISLSPATQIEAGGVDVIDVGLF